MIPPVFRTRKYWNISSAGSLPLSEMYFTQKGLKLSKMGSGDVICSLIFSDGLNAELPNQQAVSFNWDAFAWQKAERSLDKYLPTFGSLNMLFTASRLSVMLLRVTKDRGELGALVLAHQEHHNNMQNKHW